MIGRRDNTLFQQLSLVQADWKWKQRETYTQAQPMNDANRLRRPSMEVRMELNEVANCFLEVQNANTVFKAWETKLTLCKIVESDRTDLEYLESKKNKLGNDNS